MRLANFLGLGVQKGGTTYLHSLMMQHPQLYMAHLKEVHFFTLHFEKGIEWYSQYYSQAGSSQQCGEITPYYLYHPLAPTRIQKIIPSCRLIILLRDPLERALSHYFHSRRLGLEPLCLREAIEAETHRLQNCFDCLSLGKSHPSHQHHSYLSRSRYEQQLPKFQTIFPDSHILVVQSESFFREPANVWKRIQEFLQVDPIPLPQSSSHYSGNGDSMNISLETRRLIYRSLEGTYVWANKNLQMIWPSVR